MAHVAVALGRVITKLGKLLKEEYDLQKGVRKKIMCLSKDLEMMQAALEKMAEVPPEQLDQQDKLWAREVRQLSYYAEDVVDRFLLRVDGREAPDPNMFKRAAKKICKELGKIKARHQIDSKIESINQRARELKVRTDTYKVNTEAESAPSSTVDRRTWDYKAMKGLVGLEKPRDELISKLNSDNEMQTVLVVGVGGLGKTTIVKAVYDKLIDFEREREREKEKLKDKEVDSKADFEREREKEKLKDKEVDSKADFEREREKEKLKDKDFVSAFVSVGKNPDMKQVFRDILMGLDKDEYTAANYDKFNANQLSDELEVYLKDKRYLIVIDDLWEAETWNRCKSAFFKVKNQSILITTTRISTLADQDDKVYEPQPLSEKDSKRLFYTRVFGGKGTNPDNQLDKLSGKILKTCSGVPLAIIGLAGLLMDKPREQWIKVSKSIGIDDTTMKILSLSYYDLRPRLKTCLLYLSAFPEDYFIDKSSLIWKWVAEGFVHQEEGTGLFEVGERYFYELINRSLIMATKSEPDLYGCRVHDMVLVLLRKISREENFVTIPDNDGRMTISDCDGARRLAQQKGIVELTHQDRHLNWLGYLKCTHQKRKKDHLISLIACHCDYKVLSLQNFKLLRVLALEHCKAGEGFIYLEHIESLVHLRYIGLRGTSIQELPESIGALKLLQTLDVSNTRIVELPLSIGQLTQLICLHASVVKGQNGVIENLTSLEDLRIAFCGDIAGQLTRELGNLSELKTLNLKSIDTIEQSDLIDSLGKLHKIRYLCLHGNMRYMDDLENGLVLPETLQHLFLRIMFHALPSWINDEALPNLFQLDLSVQYMDEKALKTLGKLPELRYLSLTLPTESTVTLTIHDDHGCFFQKLRSLLLAHSMVWFVPNKGSSVSFTIGNEQHDVAASTGTRKGALAVMPNLEMLQFRIKLNNLVDCNRGSCASLGLNCLPSLQIVKVDFDRNGVCVADVEKEEAALRRATQEHPNRPILQMNTFGKPTDRNRPMRRFSEIFQEQGRGPRVPQQQASAGRESTSIPAPPPLLSPA